MDHADRDDLMETYAEERTRLVNEYVTNRDNTYRLKHGISKTETYYHEEENMYRPDYITAILLHKSL